MWVAESVESVVSVVEPIGSAAVLVFELVIVLVVKVALTEVGTETAASSLLFLLVVYIFHRPRWGQWKLQWKKVLVLASL